MSHQDFVDKHYTAVIDRVTSVLPIADKLLEKKMLSRQMYLKIIATDTSEDKMRTLLSVVTSGGPEVKSYFYEVLKLNEPYLVQDLEGSSSQTSSEVQESQVETQDNTGKPEKDLTRWNQSSIKHRSAIEEFMKDPSKRKIGNIYFSRNHIIGSGSSGTPVYLGLKEDGTEVAIKRIMKNPLNNKHFENELKHLQDLNLESKNIVRYVDFAEDDDFYYLALQLCECDLESYMKDFHEQEHENKDTALKKIVKDVLLGFQDLHHAEVIHRDVKPKNVLIDSGNNVRLADFGLSRKLEEGSTVYTGRAGTRGWEAVETLDPGNTGYKKNSDVQVAGMLVYYILSDGKHPFDVNNSKDRETNIKEGTYSLDGVCDIVAQDLIKRMINRNPAQRPTIDEALQHPYFWDDDRFSASNCSVLHAFLLTKATLWLLLQSESCVLTSGSHLSICLELKDAVLRKLGDREEVQFYGTLKQIYNLCNGKESDEGGNPGAALTLDTAIQSVVHKIKDPKRKEEVRNAVHKAVGEDLAKLQNLCETAKKHSVEKSFSAWKTDLLLIWTLPKDIDPNTPEEFLGLIRFMRNKLVHEKARFDEKKMLNRFTDFFISLHGLAKDLSWDY